MVSAGKAGLGLNSVNNSSAIWAIGILPSCLVSGCALVRVGENCFDSEIVLKEVVGV